MTENVQRAVHRAIRMIDAGFVLTARTILANAEQVGAAIDAVKRSTGSETHIYCGRCDHDTHICPGCGDPLTHDGRDSTGARKGETHDTRCVD